MTCSEVSLLLDAKLDNELDMASSATMDLHLRECHACAAQYTALEKLRDEIVAADLGYAPRGAFERKLADQFLREPKARFGWSGRWFNTSVLAAAAGVAIVVFAISTLRINTESNAVAVEILDNHLRALQAVHQVDVPSTDQHTVKPWFQGKTDFSPPVPDLTKEDFILVGGRLEVIHQQPAAAIVYRRRQHVIDLYVSPSVGGNAGPELQNMGGYHLLHWTQGNMSYWAVSDVDPTDLRAFADLIRGT